MLRNRLWSWALPLMLLALSITIAPQKARAQTNLLTDPGFESTAVWKNVTSAADDSASFNVAPAWNGWLTTTGSETWQNVIPNGYPHSKRFEGEPFVRSGNRSQNIGRGGGTFTAAVYQTVAVEEGANVIGSAYVVMDIPAGANSQARVGIDPNGGNSPFDGDIVWSAWGTNIIGQMRQLTAQATSTGTAVTLWLYATQTVPSNPNGVFWDDASLTVGGSGGSAGGEDGDATDGEDAPEAAPPPPASVPFVQAQGAQDDGSIIHTVQSGDTINSISVAYNVSPDEIIALNELANPRLLSVGQQLIIREAGSDSGDDEGDAGDSADEEDSGADDATEEPAAEDAADDATDDPADDDPAEDPAGDDGGEAPADDADDDPADDDPADDNPADDAAAADDDEGDTAPPTAPTPAPTAPVAVADAAGEPDDLNETAGMVCAIMFEDANMNRLQDADEVALAGGTITLIAGGDEVGSVLSDATGDPLCFDDLAAGEYTVSALPPANYGLTTPTQLRLRVQVGSDLTVQFGAATGVEVAQAPPADSGDLTEEEAAPPEPETEDENPIMQNLGLIIFGLAGLTLVGGGVIALLLRRS